MMLFLYKTWNFWVGLFGDPYIAVAVLSVLIVMGARLVAGGQLEDGR